MPTLLDSPIPSILSGALRWSEEPAEDGRMEVYHQPEPGRLYGAGSDHAHGLADGDWDTLCIFDKTDRIEGRRPRQVFEAQGHWGARFHKVLYACLRLYNDAFLMPEQQGGGDFAAVTLWREYGYRRIYRHVIPGKVREDPSDNPRLGWPAQANDVVLARFRNDVADGLPELNSEPLLKQMGNLQWRAKSADVAERASDDQRRIHLPGGGSPDLTRAAAYGWYALSVMTDHAPAPPPATVHRSFDRPDVADHERGKPRRLGRWAR